MKSFVVIAASILILAAAGCEKPVAQASAPVASPNTFDAATATLLSDRPIIPASNGQGDYLVADGGLWLLRGNEALRVREVKSFTSTTQAVAAR